MTSVQQSGPGDFVAVILAAGRGSRLGEHTVTQPKGLVEVNGTPILINALQRLAAAGVRDTSLVVGYRAELVRERIGDQLGPMRISYCENAAFATTNTTRSLYAGLATVARDLLVLEGDVFFEQRVLDDLLSHPAANATVVERWRPDLDGSVVMVGTDSAVNAWLREKDRPAGFPLQAAYKTVNIHRFSRAFTRDWLQPVLAAHVAADGGREPIETALAEIVRNGGRIYASEARGRWVEIDTESDLRQAEAVFGEASYGSR